MHVAQINYAFDDALTDPEALLDCYGTLTGWSEALVASGATRVSVFQRFARDRRVTRHGVDYVFCADGAGGEPRRWTRPRQLHDACADARPDVVHVNGLSFPVQTWLLRHRLGDDVPIVVQDHASGNPKMNGAPPLDRLRRALRHGLNVADGFIFTAMAQADPWRDAGLIAADARVYEIPEASTSFKALPRADARKISGVQGDPAVLWVGRLNENKDPLTVLAGFEQSLEHLPGAALTMVYGEQDLLPSVRARVTRSESLRDRVRLVGRVAHEILPAYYSAADLFVLGSHHEGSGYALIEACACGAAPVVTDIPTFRVMTAGGTIGGLWTPGDASDCARSLAAVGRSDLAVLRQHVENHFNRALSWNTVGRQAIAAYADVVARHRHS